MSQDTNVVFPHKGKTVVLTLTDEQGLSKEVQVVVRRFRMKEVVGVLKALAPINGEIERVMKEGVDPTVLFMRRPDDVLRFVAVCADMTEDQLNQASPDEVISLFSTVLEVNLDFFIQKVLPTLMGALTRLRDVWSVRNAVLPKPAANEAPPSGPTSSSASASTDTATPT